MNKSAPLKNSFIAEPSQKEVEDFCHAAYTSKNADITKFLDKYGAAIIERENAESKSALRLAAMGGQTATVALLLEKGASIDKKSKKSGLTALMFAAWNGHRETVALLLEKGASLDQKDNIGNTALYHAVGAEDVEKLLKEWPEMQRQKFAAERAVIKKICIGGLIRPIPYKGPFKFPTQGGQP